jgi:hypothetical protein
MCTNRLDPFGRYAPLHGPCAHIIFKTRNNQTRVDACQKKNVACCLASLLVLLKQGKISIYQQRHAGKELKLARRTTVNTLPYSTNAQYIIGFGGRNTKLAAVVAQTSLEFVWRTSDHHTHERLNERARKLSMAICAHDVEWRASCPVEDAAFAEPS